MRIGSRQFHFDGQTYVMGILNVTPDSFSDGGLYLDPGKALDYALQMQAEGADLLDIGGESTRPGAESVPSEDEWKRLCPILNPLASRLSIPISVDTRKASVARRALGEGASLINDISALGDPEMAGVLATAQAPVILMHMRGEPGTMQAVPIHYDDVVLEIIEFLEGRMRHAVARGVSPEGILIDPGLGFGKRPEDNWEILKRLQEFCRWNAPVVIGASRKSFVRQRSQKPTLCLRIRRSTTAGYPYLASARAILSATLLNKSSGLSMGLPLLSRSKYRASRTIRPFLVRGALIM